MHMAVMASLMAKLVKMVAMLVMAGMTVMAVAIMAILTLMNGNVCHPAMHMAAMAMLGNVDGHQANGDGTIKANIVEVVMVTLVMARTVIPLHIHQTCES